jgi:hypothetical protein
MKPARSLAQPFADVRWMSGNLLIARLASTVL